MLALLSFVLITGLVFILFKVKQKRRVSVKEGVVATIGLVCVGLAIQYGLNLVNGQVYRYNTPKNNYRSKMGQHLAIDSGDIAGPIGDYKPPLEVKPAPHLTIDKDSKPPLEVISSNTRSNAQVSLCSTAWVSDRPLTDDLLANIKHFQNSQICTLVHVYCGTSQCVHVVTELGNPSITSEFLVISNLVEGTPFDAWFARHPLYKVYGWSDYEDHLQTVVQLGILWKYGGTYIDPRIRVTGDNRIFTDPSVCRNGWTSDNNSKGTLDISCFPKHHPFLEKLGEEFISEYKQGLVGKEPSTKFVFDFASVYKKVFSQCKQDNTCPDSVALQCVKHTQDESLFKRNHYATLSYYLRVLVAGAGNLGDEIQASSGLQYLPFVDNLLERDRMNKLKEKVEPVTAILNAWYGDPKADWPPPSNVQPIMVSIHAHELTKNLWRKKASVDYFKQHEPIGCRDTSTVDFMESLNVEAYFSGCMTLMLKNPNVTERTGKIIINDVKKENMDLIPPQIRKSATYLHHGMWIKWADPLRQFTKGYHLLEQYATAKLVITQRIHCALPCVGMGIPVIFIQSLQLPGGEGTKTESSPRSRGLTPMFHTVDLYKMSREEAIEWLKNFPWDNPPPNPNARMIMRMRTTFWNVMRQNQGIKDASLKFGMVPLQPPPVQAVEKERDEKLLIHLVFTASTFKWYHWRTVESIFHHHPFAKVVIHSNTLQQSEFEVLTQGGYSIKVEVYSLAYMLKDSPAEEFISKLSGISDETNLLRLLVLYKWGGVYMDNDMIVVNPIDKLPKNVLTWEDASNRSISGSFMALEKDSDFLRDYLMAFGKNNDNSKTTSGSDLLTDVWNQSKNKGEVVAMKSALFYMFSESEIMSECLLASSSYDERMKFLKEEAFAIRLNLGSIGEKGTKLSKGTICKYVFNTFCILCNNLY